MASQCPKGRSGLVILLVGAMLSAPSQLTAEASAPNGSRPPITFSISDVEVVLERARYSAECPSRTITIRGEGESSCVCAQRREDGSEVLWERSFTVAVADLKALLTKFYELAFFDLSGTYFGSVVLRVDQEGQVEVLRRVPAPVDSRDLIRLSIRIGEYSTSVEALPIGLGSPPAFKELYAHVERIASEYCEEAEGE